MRAENVIYVPEFDDCNYHANETIDEGDSVC